VAACVQLGSSVASLLSLAESYSFLGGNARLSNASTSPHSWWIRKSDMEPTSSATIESEQCEPK